MFRPKSSFYYLHTIIKLIYFTHDDNAYRTDELSIQHCLENSLRSSWKKKKKLRFGIRINISDITRGGHADKSIVYGDYFEYNKNQYRRNYGRHVKENKW